MRSLFAFILVFLALSPPARAAVETSPPILLKNSVVVEGPTVQLGDLFDGLGEQAAAPVARAPAPGKRVEVSARWLTAVAQAYGLPWRASSRLERAVIERASITIGMRRIEEETLDALARRGVTGNISLVLDNPGLQLHLPTDAAPTLSLIGLSYDPVSGRFSAQVAAPAEGVPLAKATISGRAIAMAEIPVLRRRMLPGEVIRQADIEWLSLRSDRIARNTLTESGNLVGKSPRRPIRSGEAIMSNALREPILVPKNSLVTIHLQTNRMVLTAQGRALEEGAKGDVIRIMNTKSSTVINASIVEAGNVKVVLEALSRSD